MNITRDEYDRQRQQMLLLDDYDDDDYATTTEVAEYRQFDANQETQSQEYRETVILNHGQLVYFYLFFLTQNRYANELFCFGFWFWLQAMSKPSAGPPKSNGTCASGLRHPLMVADGNRTRRIRWNFTGPLTGPAPRGIRSAATGHGVSSSGWMVRKIATF